MEHELKSKEIEKYKKKLNEYAAAALEEGEPDKENGADTKLMRIYGTGEAGGRQIYKSYTDEELLELLRTRTKELGHVPAQKEVFWVHRHYLRLRFDKWPYALKKAGLSAKAGKGGMTVEMLEERNRRYEELMELVRAKARELGRPPHMFEMQEIRAELKNWFMTWADVLKAAGVDIGWQKKEILFREKNLTEEDKALLLEALKVARGLGRTPLRSEVPDETRRGLSRRFGTWRNALYQIGLEPVTKISPFGNTYLDNGREQQKKHKDVLENSLFRLVGPDDQTKHMLAEVRVLADQLGRAPIRSEIPSRTYSCLIQKCCTYRNLLYQIGLVPLDKNTAAAVQRMLRKKKQREEKI